MNGWQSPCGGSGQSILITSSTAFSPRFKRCVTLVMGGIVSGAGSILQTVTPFLAKAYVHPPGEDPMSTNLPKYVRHQHYATTVPKPVARQDWDHLSKHHFLHLVCSSANNKIGRWQVHGSWLWNRIFADCHHISCRLRGEPILAVPPVKGSVRQFAMSGALSLDSKHRIIKVRGDNLQSSARKGVNDFAFKSLGKSIDTNF